MIKTELNEFLTKKEAVDDFSAVASKHFSHIKEIKYEVFRNKEEFVVIKFTNDRICPRCVSATSIYGIYKEILDNCMNGNYDHMDIYKEIKESSFNNEIDLDEEKDGFANE